MKSDRDQSIERLLRALPRSGSRTSHDDSCPDAETLAALADHTLAPAVRRDIEIHVADCDRCQMLTAALVRTEGLVTTAAEEAARVQSWKRRAFNWLVPAAAAATAVALWVIVPGQRAAVVPAGPELDRQIAITPPGSTREAQPDIEFEPRAGALRDTPGTPPADARADNAARGRALARPSEVAQVAPGATPPAAEPSLKAESSPAVAGAPSAAPVVGDLQDSGTQEDVAGGRPPSREASADRRRIGGGGQASGERQVSGQAARNEAASRDTTLQENVSVAAGIGSFDVVSPTLQVRWRIGPGTLVQHSADGGVTWARQQSGAAGDLTAGSSPSADVCWLVGRRGLVLRTTDGGRQWQRVPLPETVDIIAVAAPSALNATVSSGDGRRFQTTDGGRTWAPVP